MELTWLGHSCFILKNSEGTTVLTDPPAPQVGYDIPLQQVDVVTVSHDHFDHCYLQLAQGEPVVIREPGAHCVNDVNITGVATWHDEEQGAQRGTNIMYAIEMDGIRILHAGDLGHELTAEQIAAAGHVDVLLVPVGGVYTVDHLQAIAVANQLHPSVVIPMHYATSGCKVELGRLVPFLTAAKDCSIHRMRCNTVVLTKESLGNDRIITLDHSIPTEG